MNDANTDHIVNQIYSLIQKQSTKRNLKLDSSISLNKALIECGLMEDEEYGKYIVRKITTLLREVIHDGTESIDNLKFIIKKTDTFVYQNYGMYSISAPFKNVKFHNISAQEIRNLIESSETSIDFIKNLIINAAKYEGEIKDTDNSSTFRITQRIREDIIIPISNFISYNKGIAKDIIKKNEERLSSPSPVDTTKPIKNDVPNAIPTNSNDPYAVNIMTPQEQITRELRGKTEPHSQSKSEKSITERNTTVNREEISNLKDFIQKCDSLLYGDNGNGYFTSILRLFEFINNKCSVSQYFKEDNGARLRNNAQKMKERSNKQMAANTSISQTSPSKHLNYTESQIYNAILEYINIESR